MNATNAKTDNKVETVKTETTLTPQQIKAQLAKAEREAKKQDEADKKASQMILQIGSFKIELLSGITTLRKFKSVVNAYFYQFELNKKDTKIILPNGVILYYSNLSTVKNFTKILFSNVELNASDIHEVNVFVENIDKVKEVVFNTPIDWEIVGTKDALTILTLYKNASTKATAEKLIPSDIISKQYVTQNLIG